MLTSEIKNTVAQEGPVSQTKSDQVCPATDLQPSSTSKAKTIESITSLKKGKCDGRKASSSSTSSLNCQLQQSDTRQISPILNKGSGVLHADSNDACNSDIVKRGNIIPPLPISDSINKSNRTKVNATTETPQSQLVVTFSNDTIGDSHSEDSFSPSYTQQQKSEIMNHDEDDETNDSIIFRKNSCEGSYGCCCDDTCYNGRTITQDKTMSNVDSGKTTPSCFHSNTTNMCPHSSSVKNTDTNSVNGSSNYATSNNKKDKVTVATQTASVSVSSSLGTPGSNEEQKSLKGLTNERTLTSVIGSHNKGCKSSPNNSNQPNAVPSKHKCRVEPLSLMQEVPDVSL